MHAGHKVVKCRRHGIVIMQCRCPDANKPVEFQDECAHQPADVEVDRLRIELRKVRTALTEAEREIEELRDLAGRRATVLAFFRSVIICREPWTERCQIEYDAAMTERRAIREARRGE